MSCMLSIEDQESNRLQWNGAPSVVIVSVKVISGLIFKLSEQKKIVDGQ